MINALRNRWRPIRPLSSLHGVRPNKIKHQWRFTRPNGLITEGQRWPCKRSKLSSGLEAANDHIRRYGLGENPRFKRSIQGGIGPVPKQSGGAQHRDKRCMECKMLQAKRCRYLQRVLYSICHTQLSSYQKIQY